MSQQLENFPELVKKVRKQLRISQEELAHKLGVSFATVNRWENGKTAPSKLAQRQFEQFCKDQVKKGGLDIGASVKRRESVGKNSGSLSRKT